MTNKNKCRVCLADGAEFPIFESIENKESIYSKLCLCFQEKIEDIEGYPRNVCETCNEELHTVCNFITKYKTSCKLLESSLIIKKEVNIDNDLNNDFFNQEFEIELGVCKKEPSESDWLESLDNQKQEINLSEKLKSLKEINFKRKSIQKSVIECKTSKIAASILEAEFVWNEERWCLKSSKLQEPKKVFPKEKQTNNKLVLPKLPKGSPSPLDKKLCDICGDIFKDHDKLAAHKKRQHFSSPIKCPICPRILRCDYNLKRHTRRCHGNKSFICDSCGFGFAFQGELNKHKRVKHLGIKRPLKKNHSCHRCDKSFTNAKSLIIHDRSAHTGIRPAECKECGASFYHEDYLKEHVRLHTGETPFKCPICGRGYAQRGNMKSHMSHNHRLADLSPAIINTLKPSHLRYLKKP